jgi:hypothetical protein
MKHAFAIVAFLIATPAFAEDTCPPKTDDIQPLSCGVVPQTGWQPFGTVVVSADDLQTQIETNRAHRLRFREQLINAGGCNGDDLPVEVASYCNRDAFGFPMGSQGGSD